MQNRYVGDLGDFGKYGLLRCFAARLTLGVGWYLVADEAHNADGRHIRYLNLTDDACVFYGVKPCSAAERRRNTRRFRTCDAALYDALQILVMQQQRTVQHVAEAAILPHGTVFVDERVPSNATRRAWFDALLNATENRDLVFVDPDNGLDVPSQTLLSQRGVKYAGYAEVAKLFERDQSVLVYQHLDRTKNMIDRRRNELAEELAVRPARVHGLRYGGGSARVFYAVAAPPHDDIVRERIETFFASAWRQHFSRV